MLLTRSSKPLCSYYVYRPSLCKCKSIKNNVNLIFLRFCKPLNLSTTFRLHRYRMASKISFTHAQTHASTRTRIYDDHHGRFDHYSTDYSSNPTRKSSYRDIKQQYPVRLHYHLFSVFLFFLFQFFLFFVGDVTTAYTVSSVSRQNYR